jgi:hypothetical protein
LTIGKPQTSKSIIQLNIFSKLLLLDQIEYFKQYSDITGILYYSKSNTSRDRLYWKDNGTLKDALKIDFDLTNLDAVNKIIGTIKRK